MREEGNCIVIATTLWHGCVRMRDAHLCVHCAASVHTYVCSSVPAKMLLLHVTWV